MSRKKSDSMEKLLGMLAAILAVTVAGFVSYLVLQCLTPGRATLKIEGRVEHPAPAMAGSKGEGK